MEVRACRCERAEPMPLSSTMARKRDGASAARCTAACEPSERPNSTVCARAAGGTAAASSAASSAPPSTSGSRSALKADMSGRAALDQP